MEIDENDDHQKVAVQFAKRPPEDQKKKKEMVRTVQNQENEDEIKALIEMISVTEVHQRQEEDAAEVVQQEIALVIDQRKVQDLVQHQIHHDENDLNVRKHQNQHELMSIVLQEMSQKSMFKKFLGIMGR